MSLQAMAWAMKQELPGITKMVLLVLADHHNGETGQCNPATRRISKISGFGQRTVVTHIHNLAAQKLLTIQTNERPDGSRTSNSYDLHIVKQGPMQDNEVVYAAVAYQEPGIEPGKEVTETSSSADDSAKNEEVWPEWFSLGYGLKGWVISFTTAEAWRIKYKYSEEYCLDQIYKVRGWWTKEHEKKGRNPYSTFQTACRENWAGQSRQMDRLRTAASAPAGTAYVSPESRVGLAKFSQ